MYLSRRLRRPGALARLLRETSYDTLYLNSLFSRDFGILPLLLQRLGTVPRVPTLLAPRGELSPGALALRPIKKRAYIAAARSAGIASHVTWHATSEMEAADIRRVIGHGAPVQVAPNIATLGSLGAVVRVPKVRGTASAVFLSRLSPKKNMHMLAPVLSGVRGTVSLDLYGAIDDADYWAKCEKAFAGLPSNVTVSYRGTVEHTQVSEVLAAADLFILPTLGENFCHAAAEAFAAGCPVLISDQTPWRGLQAAKAGWDLPLEQPRAFTEAIQRIVDMDEGEHAEWRRGARIFIESHPLITEAIDLNRQLFFSQTRG